MFVPVSKPLLGKEETALVLDAMNRGEISGFSGSYIKQFEDKFATFCGVTDAVAVTNGTVAIHLALATLGIKAGDEVLVGTFTNMATFFAVLYQGAKPIPIDSDPFTFNLDPALLEAKITKKTKAIIVIHIYGHPVDMDPVLKIARKHKLYVIEDAAEAHGALYKGKPVGSLGDIGCFSFYANKIITTGEGGMLTTNNKKWSDRARMLKSIAFGTENKYMHQAVGFNYRMTNITAAIGVAQMSKVKNIIKKKRKVADYYIKAFKTIPQLQLPVAKPYAFNVYWMFSVVLRGTLSGRRQEFMSELKKRGVDTRDHFVPFNQQEIFIKKGLTRMNECPIANDFSKDGLFLPSGPDISPIELKYVSKQVTEVVDMLLTNKK
ncbi:MAG: DegT/DnrJ/EryC1/StrS family aminotransferase [Candidatus Taylorbacteria bacterium]|nr:DegT/DnrJ/EryC1/StrS family aminotransferase [Candidatus Taylorbacteria bacterium]